MTTNVAKCTLYLSLCAPIELRHGRPRLAKDLRKSKRFVDTIALLFLLLSPVWEKEFLAPSIACSTANAFEIVAWTVMSNLMKFRRIKSRKLLQDYFLTDSMIKTLLGLFPVEPQESWYR